MKREESKSPDVLVVALSTTVAVCVVISIFTFIVGFLCSRCSYTGQKHKRSPKKLPDPPITSDSNRTLDLDPPITSDSNRTLDLDPPIASQPAAVPLYEDVDALASAVKHQGKDLELKENVAYHPSKSSSIEQQ